jgi:hypothetical protein
VTGCWDHLVRTGVVLKAKHPHLAKEKGMSRRAPIEDLSIKSNQGLHATSGTLDVHLSNLKCCVRFFNPSRATDCHLWPRNVTLTISVEARRQHSLVTTESTPKMKSQRPKSSPVPTCVFSENQNKQSSCDILFGPQRV